LRLQAQKNQKLGVLTSAVAGVAATLLAGCNAKSFLDPSELGRGQNSDRLSVKIIDELSPGNETYDPRFPAAEDPRPDDLAVTVTDYTMGPGDVVDIAVTDLTGQGIESVNTRQVTESGNIILPLLKQPVRAEGLTEPEVAQAVADAYKNENIIQEAQVSATLRLKRSRTYSILGAIETPGEFEIATNDFRLLNALTQARDVPAGQALGIDYIYIIRKTKFDPGKGTATPASAPAARPAGRDPLAPRSQGDTKGMPHTFKPAPLMQNNPAPATPATADAPTAANAPATVPAAGETEGRFIIVDGKPVQVGAQPGAAAPAKTGATPAAQTTTGTGVGATGSGSGTTGAQGSFAFNAPETEGETRAIRIPFDRLRNGDLKYNVVIRPQDMIIIPTPRVQTYYMGGHVGAPGAYQMIPGNKLTLMEAIISARMLDGVAIPERTDVIRRNGDQKTWVRVDLNKIFAGQQPDLYLKENDNVLVGTNPVAPFLAAFRNAFRVTYGFGFLYDRNFAAEQNNQGLN
jgi:polysaccharide biosynthesis/export protein